MIQHCYLQHMQSCNMQNTARQSSLKHTISPELMRKNYLFIIEDTIICQKAGTDHIVFIYCIIKCALKCMMFLKHATACASVLLFKCKIEIHLNWRIHPFSQLYKSCCSLHPDFLKPSLSLFLSLPLSLSPLPLWHTHT